MYLARIARVTKVKLNRSESASLSAEVGVVTPTKCFMTSEQHDFIEGYWTGESAYNIPITNWETSILS